MQTAARARPRIPGVKTKGPSDSGVWPRADRNNAVSWAIITVEEEMPDSGVVWSWADWTSEVIGAVNVRGPSHCGLSSWASCTKEVA